ncbi:MULTISPECIES: 3-oxoacyl-[acyl-carrier-protein] reductase [Thalassospira]|jgi:3-oxoacyl-[acyl-carrier protein] reductase|uniref:3-oxoacyl-[acyl-carrier-protein] reductase n=1 Tax=Thalassospira lucentensis TaxID=168935 RepID=A0A358HPI3_9PROT|nr:MULTISPECIES: 3-oxoacyl-[acyl-carrier-protein] reductase [Thalassospira]MBV16854.1 3-oxoacyl-[acyl-carrier-protein] reductase [Thalassospira sp.]RCK27643.1 3-oxoacyl-ACP synthase [Thalassospira lucentensis MCCC 1A00383 = DSM 14000]HBU96684.1 3-oxoacyl-[acyl-carrier-protein] reductase [Thalassospira lucentensis]HCW67598.1 3-oxoacyl-[acyl-carrier-protein] reductase [Thalassospira lucentensis]|tara:strand:+ start:64052 stop:64792 length:741 start_codon:yes stop_codon:yes gene_type:complete
MFDLAGKTALVTGATGGIGGEIAKVLAQAGAKVALSGTRAERLEAVAAEIGENAVVVPANLSDTESVDGLIKAAEEALGGQLDILVNNAGITRDQLAMRLKDEDWQAVLDVNLTSAFKLARNSLRGMMKRRHGRVINITSIVGVTGNPGQANYAAAKAGMIGWSKSMAQEVAARGITINCVAPGFITTAMTEELGDAQKEKLLAGIPAGRMGDSKEIAAAVLFLASDEASYVTGQTLHVNGGMAMI